MDNIYRDNGYSSRKEYLQALASDYNIDLETVLTLADLLGPSEDFDGLILSLEELEV